MRVYEIIDEYLRLVNGASIRWRHNAQWDHKYEEYDWETITYMTAECWIGDDNKPEEWVKLSLTLSKDQYDRIPQNLRDSWENDF